MTIQIFTEHWKERSLTSTSTRGTQGNRIYQCVSDDPSENEITILSYAGCPQLGDVFPGTNDCYCVSRSVRRGDSNRVEFWVTCAYESQISQATQNQIDEPNPIYRSAIVEWSPRRSSMVRRRVKRSDCYNTYSAAIEGTFSMRLDANSAGDPYEPLMDIPVTEWVATVSKNVETIPTWITDYQDSVNSVAFSLDFYGTTVTIEKGRACLDGLVMPLQMTENGITYVRLQMQIAIKPYRDLRSGETIAPEPWDIERLDAGMRTRSNSKWKAITGDDGLPITHPIPFNGSGAAVSTSGSAIAETDLKYYLVAPNKRRDFNNLPLW